MAAWLTDYDLDSIVRYYHTHIHEIEHFDPKNKAVRQIQDIVTLAEELQFKIKALTKPLGW